MHRHWLLPTLALALKTACATDPTVSFQTEGKAKVAAVGWDNLEGEGQPLGETPLTVPLSQLNGKILRIAQDKKLPQFWVVSCDDQRERLTARLKLVDAPDFSVAKAPDDAKKADGEDGDGGAAARAEAAATSARTEANAALVKAKMNKMQRMLLKSYEALLSDDPGLARELADQLSKEAPDLASPFIIIGLSHLRSGNRAEARNAFAKAQTLDPEDPSTSELMRLTQF